ncbi:hypothetical protein L9059_28290 [Pseudomonas sp. TNT19]|uniref:Uncharacterized protein n=1 Tax=Pseudomonas violetae TaxID=2915813 RepID=A0ABT0F7Q7_9PSED|nr:hypothetical protein [Pseudomonas violetae]
MDKAISWPLSQENSKRPETKALDSMPDRQRLPILAPLRGKAIDHAVISRIGIWLKIDQSTATHTGYGVAAGMNGLSTACSTVFVRKPEHRA